MSSADIYLEGKTYSTDRSANTDGLDRVIVSPTFFQVMGMPIVLGRGVSDGDTKTSPKVVVVNEAAVKAYFSPGNPLGRHFGTSPEHPDTIEIVGVVRDAKYNDLRTPAPPTMYLPYAQAARAQASFELRTYGPPQLVSGAVRAAVRELDPNLPIVRISTQMEQIEQRFRQEKLFAQAYGLFGLIALVLASVGLFGLMSYSVARRTAEMGIRMALGAQQFDVLRMVMRESLTLVAVGVGAGLVVAALSGRLITKLLFGLAPHDVSTMAMAIGVMAGVSAVAAYLPARRASHVDPMIALRFE